MHAVHVVLSMAAIIATAARTATAARFEAVSERDAHFAAVALKEDGNEAVKAGDWTAAVVSVDNLLI